MSRPCVVCEATTNAYLCKPCLNEIDRVIGDWASLLYEVSVLATKQTRVYRANTRGTDTDDEATYAELLEYERWQWLAVPTQLRSKQGRITLPATQTVVNLGARDLFDAATTLIVTWARHLAETRGVQIPTPARVVVDSVFIIERNRAAGVVARTVQPNPMPAVYGWLLANIDAIRWDEAAGPIHRELTGMHRRMTRAVDRSPSRLYAGPCEQPLPDKGTCKAQLFTWPPPRFDDDIQRMLWEADNPIECDGHKPPLTDPTRPWIAGCGHRHQRAARRAWLVDDLEDRLLPWSLLEDALPSVATDLQWPSVRTWFRWRKLVPVKTVIDGTEFYRGGDVMDLCRREQQRIKGNSAKPHARRSA